MAAATTLKSLLARVLILNINPGHISTPTVRGLLSASASGCAVMADESPPYLDDARNAMIAKAITVRGSRRKGLIPWDHVLFVDSDVAFNPDSLATLFSPMLHPDYDPQVTPVMCGVYYNTFDEMVPGDDEECGAWTDPVVYEWVRRTYKQDDPSVPTRWGFRRLSQLAFATREAYDAPWNPPAPAHSPTSGLITEVGAAGTGFMAIHHSVIDDLSLHHEAPTPWFAEPNLNRTHLGEDMAFCHRVRALGYPVLVNRACVLLHGKTVWLP